ncbi:hypothetical protein ACIQ9P_21730 [Kitasatospora sp. NPDC094019]|uniref:hypothetical protein n=1 Tax=Kitasatospora sp. NPDC094019 TaxID=3364091 RepID=UPI00381CCE8C
MADNVMGKVAVQPTDLRASAGVAKGLGAELGTPVQQAVTTSETVAGQLAGWSIAGGLGQLGSGWSKPLGDLRQRLADTSANLEANAAAHQHADHGIAGALTVAPQGAK